MPTLMSMLSFPAADRRSMAVEFASLSAATMKLQEVVIWWMPVSFVRRTVRSFSKALIACTGKKP